MTSLEIFFYDWKFSSLNYDSLFILGKEYSIENKPIKIQLDDNSLAKQKVKESLKFNFSINLMIM